MLVETREELADLVEELAGMDVIAVDTEFHGEKRYWPELFLVQLATDDLSAAVDPLALEDLSPLSGLLGSDRVVKAFHSAKNDIAILRRYLDTEILNVFDTQIAASFLGYGEQCGLTFLLREVCGIPAQKRFSMSDWSRRPLAEEQLQYALDDVRFLVGLYRELSGSLRDLDRLQWCLDETAILSSPETYENSIDSIYRRARSSGRLRRGGEGALWELVRWREKTAQDEDRPRQRIASDSLLRRIAAMSPTTVDDLATLRGLPGGFLNTFGGPVVDAVGRGSGVPLSAIPGDARRQKSDPGASARRDVLRIYAKHRASELGIARTMLLPKEVLSELSSAAPSSIGDLEKIPGLGGWRAGVLGEDLLAILQGSMHFSLEQDPSKGVRFERRDDCDARHGD